MLAELPPELILHIVAFLTRLPGHYHLAKGLSDKQELIPDLPSINALSQTNSVLYRMLNETLYDLCADVESLAVQALLFAVIHERESTLDKCVAAGISLDAFSRDLSVLHFAAARGLRAMVVKLLDMYGEGMMARVHACTARTNGTALDGAAYHGKMEVVRLLAPIPMPSPDVYYNLLSWVSALVETREEYLGRALLQSTNAGNLEISEYLLQEGADVNFCQGSYTPLFYAVYSKKLGLLKFLLASGADPNLTGSGEIVPLFSAAMGRSMELIEALLAGGAEIHAQNSCSCNALAYAKDTTMFRFFLERGVDPNHRDASGRTSLHHACCLPMADRESATELLVQYGAAIIEGADDYRHTPVDLAMKKDIPQIVRMLELLVHDPRLKKKITKWWKKREAADTKI
ncbi:ankyrin repeat-containing domain protein [Mycena sanguinolenta]|nr:ankyrin repeat-containing domain protein [Mycena sanguinolenta]